MQTSFSRAQAEHRRLLTLIKSTVEQLFLSNRSSVTDDNNAVQSPEELIQLHAVVEQIFVNGIRLHRPDRSPDIWSFIEGLNWLNPSMTVSVANPSRSSDARTSIPVGRIRSDKALVWLYENLARNQLFDKLKYLVSDTEHLNNCYEVWAFLQSSKYLGAFLLCLRAIENNQPNLLTQIDASLLLRRQDGLSTAAVGHKRSTSHPNFSLVPPAPTTTQNIPSSRPHLTRQQTQAHPSTSPPPITTHRPWSSLPNLFEQQIPPRTRRHTHSQPVRIPTPMLLKPHRPNRQHPRPHIAPADVATSLNPVVDDPTDLRPISLVKCDDIKIHFDRKHVHNNTPTSSMTTSANTSGSSTPTSTIHTTHTSGIFSFIPIFSSRSPTTGIPDDKHHDLSATSPSLYTSILAASAPTDLVNAFVPMEGEKLQARHVCSTASSLSPVFTSKMDEHGSPDEVGHASREGGEQSLTSFLQTRQFTRTHNELERENAHFSVSEAMISTIEQIKCKRWTAKTSVNTTRRQSRYSDIVRDRVKRRPFADETPVSPKLHLPHHAKDSNDKYRRTVMSAGSSSSSAASSMASSSSLTSCGSSTPSSSRTHPYASSSDECPTSVRAATTTTASDGDETTLTGSTQSLNAECQAYAEWGGSSMDNWSAESVALSLISKFSDKQIPRACDILWLVSEQDAPQTLLPMPGSWTVNPDEPYQIPFTRGTRDWAPPRPQVIFTRHAKIDRKSLLRKQNQRCAGCGMRVAAAHSHSFRYCEYLGRYHCTNCHRNQISVIPARVLDSWDFATFPVSVFAYRLLEDIWTVPLFRVSHLNRTLYAKVKALQVARQRRDQLKFVRDFVMSCRFAEEDGTQTIFAQVASHIVDDLDVWSMADFTAVRLGTFVKDIVALLTRCERQHVERCQLCMARGFICEHCPRKQIIFPWQPKVRRCHACGVCVHESCWQDDCAKCDRLQSRQRTAIGVGMSRLAPTLTTPAAPQFQRMTPKKRS